MVGQRPHMANGLHWVRGEIEQSLNRARGALEQYLEAPEDTVHLDVAAEELRLVRGTVGMIQCFGAAALAEEMLQLLQELRQNPPDPNNLEPFSALTGATLHLSDYVDLLAHGENDRAVVLQPGINELRLARGKPLLTEAELFAAQVRAQQEAPPEAPDHQPRGGEAVQAVARRELGTFQTAFVQWFRGQNTDAAMLRMGKIADAVAVNTADPNLREMWSSYAVLAECMRGDLQFDSLDLKRLFGRAGQHLKRLVDQGEAAAGAEVGDTPQQLLFHIARASRQTDRSHALITSRRIDELLPGLEQIDELRRRLRGPNTFILARVHAEIGRDFAQVKDGIDLAVRTGGRSTGDLAMTRERLQRLANTLGALGLPAPQQALLNQARMLENPPPQDTGAWMDVATAILRVEHSLEEALFRALGRHGAEPERPYAEIEAEVPHAQDLRESTRALLRESLVDLAHLKAAFDGFLKSGDAAAFGDAPRMLNEVGAGLLILDRGRAAKQLRKLEAYTQLSKLTGPQDGQAELERFADAISCVEVYLEALRDGLPEPDRILDDLESFTARLDFSTPESEAPAELPALPEIAAEIVASPPATPAPPVPQQPAAPPAPASAPVGEGIDPEIRDIFIEEAGEVLAELERLLPMLRREPGNRGVIGEVRRAFHTLKGSGRMVGAMRIGEFGWAVENMLNRCLEGALAVRAPVLQIIEQAVALLPGLVENFRVGVGAGVEDPAVAALVEGATKLAATKASTEPDMLAVFREDARERIGLVRRWLEAQDPRESGFQPDADVIRAFHTLRGSAAVIHAEGVSGLAAAFEALFNGLRLDGRALPALGLPLIADALLTLRGWIESADVVDAGADSIPGWQARIAALHAPPPAAAAAPPAVEAPPPRPPFDEAFCLQALTAAQALEQQARVWAAQPDSAKLERAAAADLGTGFADIADLAARAGCEPIMRVGQALSERLAEWRGGQVPDAAFFTALLEIIEGLYQQLDAYREGEQLDDAALIARVQALPHPAPATAPVYVPPPPEPPPPPIERPLEPELAAMGATEVPVDEELLEIFGAEAEELLESMEHYLQVWRRDPAYVDATSEIKRALHTLKGSARTAGADAIGTVAHHLESLFADDARQSPAGLQAPLGVGFDELQQLIGDLQRGRPLDAGPALEAIAAVQGRLAVPVLEVPPAPPAPPAPFEPAAQAPVLAEPPDAAEAAALPPLPADLPQAEEIFLEALPEPAAPEPLPPIELQWPAPQEPIVFAPAPPPEMPVLEMPPGIIPEIVTPAAAPDHEEAPLPLIEVSESEFPLLLEAMPEPLPQTAPEPAAVASVPEPEIQLETVPEMRLEPEPEIRFQPEAEFQLPQVQPEPAQPALTLPDRQQPSPPPPAPVQPQPDFPAGYMSEAQQRTLDDEITDIFAVEASELLELLDSGFEGWQNGDDGEPVREVQRALHTLKGGARMAGLDAMGDVVHELESRVNALIAAGEFPDTEAFQQMRGELDRLQAMHDQIRRGQAQLLVSPLETAEAGEPALVPAAAAPLAAPASGQWSPELFWRSEEDLSGYALARKETARVPVDALDAMLNEAGEISIYRSRLEERNTNMRLQLAEMSQTISRVREQLRMLDIETEAQIAARGRGLSAHPDQYSQDFDPLEMDRYSRMQELSRTLAESISDLSSLQGTMDGAVSESDTLLLQQSRITTEVQQGLMGTLMVPFSRQVQRLLRVVRQTAQENGRQAEAQFEGVEAELDRHVLERITAPLEHLLRNAVVHGIEDPAERALAGKPVVGLIKLRLSREGAQLLVELSDDGRGLDFAAIRHKAIERGMMVAEAQLSDDDLARFIFEPGFSTAKRLTQDAGRGIGMDVVASEVKQLAGTLELRSEVGKGTRFLLRLPLTLAVSQALLVATGPEAFAIPLPSIEGIARVPRAELSDYVRDDGPLFAYGGRGYRVRHLGDYIGVPHAPDPDARTYTAILVRLGEGLGAAERRVALIVDVLHGTREIVSKAVGPQVSSVAGVAGATILADGRVVLILDVAALVAERSRRALLAEAAGRAESAAAEEKADTIMVVDDSITMRRVAERLLSRNGYRVVTAKDGLDAIAMLQTETPAIVLLDIEMPRADGFEVAAFIRNNARLAAVPIIMITSRSGEKHRERARVLGVDRYLIKPYQEDQLLAEVKDMRRRH
jgi:chemosensory pili system protein ChpA (sensor histidine kinase/response regulator)